MRHTFFLPMALCLIVVPHFVRAAPVVPKKGTGKRVEVKPKAAQAKTAAKPQAAPPAAAPVKDLFGPEQRKAADTALLALRKLNAATSVGVSFSDYQSRLIDTKAAVDEALRSISDPSLESDISASMQAYQDASVFWNDCNQLVTRKKISGGDSGPILIKYGQTLPDTDADAHRKTVEDQTAFDQETAKIKRLQATGDPAEGDVALLHSMLEDFFADLVNEGKIGNSDEKKILTAIWTAGSQKEGQAETLLGKP